MRDVFLDIPLLVVCIAADPKCEKGVRRLSAPSVIQTAHVQYIRLSLPEQYYCNQKHFSRQMVAIIAALAATLYISGTTAWSLLLYSTFDDKFIQAVPQYKMVTESLASFFAENPLHLMFIKWILTLCTKLFGGFRYSLTHLAYYVDILNTVVAFVVFWEQFQGREAMEKELKSRFSADSYGIPDISSLKQIKRLFNPFLKNDDIVIHPHITYATREETLDAIKLTNDYNQPRKMMLDVYTTKDKPAGLRPVLIHIHGGAWRMGTKDHLYPFENDLLTDEKWVVVNIDYRLAPVNPYPTHLKDVKRAIRWVKQCISNFGGDPNFIVLSGDSSGGHLAMMAAMTANQPQYQEGFEDVDTSVRGVISINGVMRTHIDPFFAKHACMMKEPLNKAFLLDHSPVTYVEKAHQQGNLVPSLIMIGQRDGLVNPEGAKEFTKQYQRAVAKENEPTSVCTLVEVPGGHHIFHVGWSARAMYANSVIISWCRDLHNKNK